MNTEAKEQLAKLENNLHQAHYDTYKNFVNQFSYTEGDLKTM